MITDQTTEAELTIARNREISSLRAQYPHLSYSDAHNRVRQTSPELFGLDPRGTNPVANRVAMPPGDAENLRAIEDGIEKLRASNRKLTYSAARDLLRRQQPALFGLA